MSYPNREILPVRSRKRSGQLRKSQGISTTSQDPPPISSSSPDTQASQRLSLTSPASIHRSPPRPNFASQIDFNFGQTENNLSSRGQNRSLFHNASSRQPEPTGLSPSPESQSQRRSSFLPILSRLEPEEPQPLHTLYSDEKIPLIAESEVFGTGISVLVEGDSNYAGTDTSATSQTQVPLFNTQLSELGSNSGLRQRSISVASGVSDVSCNDDTTSTYDVRVEEAPLEPFFAPAFQTALQRGLDVANNTAVAMEKMLRSQGAGGDLERLVGDARGLSTFEGSDTRTIAVLGDSGEGEHTTH
jgi:hypothetical protein